MKTIAKPVKILQLIDYTNSTINLGVIRETEKAYLIRQTCSANKDTWFPKSGFTVKYIDGIRVTVTMKDWLYHKLSPDQEAVILEVRPVY